MQQLRQESCNLHQQRVGRTRQDPTQPDARIVHKHEVVPPVQLPAASPFVSACAACANMEAYPSTPVHQRIVRPVLNGCAALLAPFRRARTPPRLVPLVTQSYDSPESLPQTTRWVCSGRPAMRVPPLLRLSYWIGASLFVPGTRKCRVNVASVTLTTIKLLIAWPLLCVLV